LRILRLPSILLLVVLLSPAGVPAQVVEGATKSVGEDSGPLSELSTNVTTGSRSVGEGSTTIGEGSVGSMISGPTHDRAMPSMISGPVSEISRGPVTSFVPVTSHVAVRDASSGAVTREAQRSVGEPLIEPEQDLAALQEQLRALRQQAVEEEALRERFGEAQEDNGADAPVVGEDDAASNEEQAESAQPPSAEGEEIDDAEDPAVEEQP
jgi:hypothetical protein